MAASTSSDVVVTGLGLISPVGLTAAQSCAAIRAGITRLTEHPVYTCIPEDTDSPEAQAAQDEEGEPLRAGVVPGLPLDLPGDVRLLRLALIALQRLLTETGLGRRDMPRTALLVALPLPDAATAPWKLTQRFTQELCQRAGVEEWAEQEAVAAGPVGVLRMVRKAAELLQARRVDFAVVLAADSFIDMERLSLLDEGWRLKSARNVDGFTPGEAGAALLLENRRAAERRGAPMLARLGPMAFGTEPSPIGSEKWSTGTGLSEALRPLLSTRPGEEVGSWVLCDLNGESYRASEWGLVRTRLAKALPPPRKLLHPADRIGDAGTALVGVLIACAAQAFVRGYAPAQSALLWAGSDDGERGALVLRAPSDNGTTP
jgi:3-oxoacyl-[acyl-carrier-protein] synthase-1